MSFLKIRPKQKKPKGIPTKEEIRLIVQEELGAFSEEQKKLSDEEKRKLLRQQKWDRLPKSTKLRLLRYLEKKGEQYGKK